MVTWAAVVIFSGKHVENEFKKLTMANKAKGNPWTDEETEALVNRWSDQNIQDGLENYIVHNDVVYGKVSAVL